MSWLEGTGRDWSSLHRITDGSESRWGDACDDEPGVYRLVALREGSTEEPATLARICDGDETGTLYIGAAPRSLTGRIGQLVRQHHPDRKGGGHLPLPVTLASMFPPERLAVCWSYVSDGSDVFAVERRLLDAYTLAFGERPPLNSMG